MPRILVADDNTNIQRMVTLAFQDRGIEVTAVGNGEAAVRRMPDLKPDLVLADIFMPVRNGYELCEWVKKDPNFSHIPVILLVGAFDPLDEKEARRVRADGVLKKPFIPPDPLIAMVTSALEKNSKIAAELHRPKEAVAAAPLPPPAPTVVEIPAQVEPKRVPEFPEPSPEEAALVYAFGTGRRAMDDADDAEDAKAPKEEGDEASEEFDGTSTTNDWRRSAMDFEVPEEAAGRPAFSSVEDLESTFPSERAVPRQHIDVPETVDEIEPSFAEETEASRLLVAPLDARAADEIATAADGNREGFEGELVAGVLATEEEALIRAALAVEAATPAARELEPETQETSAVRVEHVLEPEPNFASKATHWMDLMASSSELPQHDWFASTIQPPAKVETPGIPDSPAEPAASSMEELPAVEASAPVMPNIAEIDAAALSRGEDEPFFADELEPAASSDVVASEPSSETAVVETSSEAAGETTEEPSDNVVEHGQETPLPEPSVSPEAISELIAEPADETPSFREADLVEPPAVHVTPEPLLVEEAAQESSGYGARQEQIPPTHSFLLPAQEIRAAEKAAAKEPVEEQPTRKDFSEHREIERAGFEFSSAEFDERIPTTLPVSREVLDEIPFLNPPLDFSEHAEGHSVVNSGQVDSITVDAVVERLLQKLEPQLRELFSQSVLKPLVENLLQAEHETRER